MSETSGNLPFKPGLEKFGTSPSAYYYPDDPSRVIRIFGLYLGKSKDPEYINDSMGLFAELGDYGIDVARFAPVIFNDPYDFALAVEMVEGEAFNREDVVRMNPRQLRIAQQLIDKQFDYVEHKIDSGASFLADIYGIHQYIIAEDDRAVLVDLEPIIVTENRVKFFRPSSELYSINCILHDVDYVSGKDKTLAKSWENKGRLLIDLVSAKHNLELDQSAKDQLVVIGIDNRDGEEFDELIEDQLQKLKVQPPPTSDQK